MTSQDLSVDPPNPPDRSDSTEIHTSGGASIDGNVNAGADFVGRDKTEIGTQNIYYGLPTPNQPGPSDEPAPGESPFKGLEYFEVADAERFFGREQLTADLAGLLREQRFLAVVGASGSGKSSVVRAGLVATLQRGSTPVAGAALPDGCQQWLFYLVTPGARPLESVAAALTRHAESVTATSTLIDDLRREPRTLHLYASRLLSGQASTGKLLLVVDQFEELFTQCRDLDEQKALIDNLLTASLEFDRTVVVITLRADFYAHCARFDNLRGALERYQKYIGPMQRDELQRAIEEPARLGDWVFEAGLVEQMLDDVGDEPGALPLLSHALLETWKRRQGRRLTHAGYVAAGRVQKAIATSAETTYQQKLTPPQRSLARTLFLRLTEPGEGTQDTRRRVAWADLLPEGMESSAVETVVQRLADARLLTTSGDTGSDDRFVEVAHEALIREWPTLRGWLDEDREGLLILRRLGEAAEAWQSNGQETGFLYRGLPLQQAGQWAANHSGRLNATEQRFLLASQQAERAEQTAREQAHRREAEQNAQLAAEQARNAEQAKNNRRLLVLRNVLAGLALIALIAMGFAFVQRQQANRDKDDAIQAKADADAARAETKKLQEQIQADRMAQVAALTNIDTTLDQYPQRALLLAVEAAQMISPPVPSSLTTLHDLLGHTGGQGFGRHEGAVYSVAFSPDGKTLASGSGDNTIRLWSLAQPSADPIVLTGHESSVTSVAFAPDGKTLASGSEDGTIRLWSLAQPSTPPVVLKGHKNSVWSVAFAPDSKTLASGSDDNTIHLWSLAQPSTDPVVLKGHERPVRSVAFSPDGKTLASGSWDNTILLWSLVQSSAAPIVLKGHDSAVNSVAFSPDGKTLASGSWDYTIRLWSLAQPSNDPVVLKGHGSIVMSVAFAPDGKTLASGSWNKTIRLWSLAQPGADPVVLAGHEGAVNSVAFALDGKTLVSGSDDRTIRLWSLAQPSADPVVLAGHDDVVTSVAFAPDSKTLASGSWNHTIRLWSLAQPGADPVVLTGGHEDYVESVAFSSDGKTVASGSTDGAIRLWSLAQLSAAPVVLTGHKGPVTSVAFAPDGKTLASGSTDGTIRLWSLAGPSTPPVVLASHASIFTSVAFAPDGKTLASGNDDKTIRLWSLAQPSAAPVVLTGHKGPVWRVAFAPDGKTLASGSDDGTIRLWSLAQPSTDPVVLKGHEHFVRSVAFSPDGKTLASGSDDRTIRLWSLAQPSAAPIVLKGHKNYVRSVAFSPDGKTLASSSADQTIRLWRQLDNTELIKLACATAGRNLSREEWQRYFPDEAYRTTCPQWPAGE